MGNRSQTRFIPEEDIQAVADWSFAAVDLAGVHHAAKLKAEIEEEEKAREESVKQAGYAEGFTQGYAQATLQGQKQLGEYIEAQGREAASHFVSLFESAKAQLAESEQVMAQGVLTLATELAKQIVRNEISTNPNALQPVIREALGLLTLECKAAVVRLNPVDHEVMSSVVQQEFPSIELTLVQDASVSRGGCLIESAGTVVDGTLEKRFARVIANLGLDASWETGDERV